MEIVKVENNKKYIKDFLKIPKMIYSSADNMESPDTTRQLLEGTHPLSGYFELDAYLIYDKKDPVGRFSITTYSGDKVAYIGLFECINDDGISGFLFENAKRIAKEKNCTKLEGPVDASFWIKYRLKINNFDGLPYTGEPYNKDYYYTLFLNNGYKVKEHYTSNLYRSIDENYVNEKYESRYKSFLSQGYKIVSPKTEEYDEIIDDVYTMISRLYSDFPIYKDVSREDFKELFKSYKQIMNMSMTKIAYYDGKAVGFYISLPNYGNKVYHLHPVNLMKILRLKKKPKEYVMLYMGVEPEHRGLGKALVYSIMKELEDNKLPSIGALARDGKITQHYAQEDIKDVYEYVLMEYYI